MSPKDTFYREQTFKLLMDELKSHGTALKSFEEKVDGRFDSLNKEVDALNMKVSRIIGWASGAGAMAGLIIAYLKDKFFNHS